MTTETLKHHSGFWLRSDAAEAFDRAEDDHGVLVVNSAGRTEAQQQVLINRWNAGGAANRPPYLYEPASPASASNHVIGGGIAVDVGNWTKFAAYCGQYGFTHPYPSGDPVHFEYHGGPAPTTSSLWKERQAFLNTLGFHLVVDGIDGGLTKAAVEGYQTILRGYGYTGAIDGLWGTGTQSAHVRYLAAHTTTTPPAGGNLSYSDIQRGLNKFGYNLVVDGVWGSKSHNALGDFQRSHGLTVDYLVGVKTRAALGI